jgi:hypothetical protein
VLCEVPRLVRPCSYALALGLGLIASEVCIPLDQRCLCAPCLYSVGLVVLRDHTNRVCGVAASVYRREQGPRRFGRKLDSKDGRERSGRGLPEGTPETHFMVGRPRAIHRVTRPGAWTLRGIPCEGLQRGLGGSLSTSRYLGKNTGVIDGSLHLYLIITFRIYFATLVMFFIFLAKLIG